MKQPHWKAFLFVFFVTVFLGNINTVYSQTVPNIIVEDPDNNGQFCINIYDIPNKVCHFKMDLRFDTDVLEYSSFTRGDLRQLRNFILDVNPVVTNKPGVVRIAAFNDGKNCIPKGSMGSVVCFEFNVLNPAGTTNLCLEDLEGAIQEEPDDDGPAWATQCGLYPTICLPNGDVNEDGNITPADALMAFQLYLEMTELSECQQEHADGNNDGNITPADALCIFRKYLGLPSCLD